MSVLRSRCSTAFRQKTRLPAFDLTNRNTGLITRNTSSSPHRQHQTRLIHPGSHITATRQTYPSVNQEHFANTQTDSFRFARTAFRFNKTDYKAAHRTDSTKPESYIHEHTSRLHDTKNTHHKPTKLLDVDDNSVKQQHFTNNRLAASEWITQITKVGGSSQLQHETRTTVHSRNTGIATINKPSTL